MKAISAERPFDQRAKLMRLLQQLGSRADEFERCPGPDNGMVFAKRLELHQVHGFQGDIDADGTDPGSARTSESGRGPRMAKVVCYAQGIALSKKTAVSKYSGRKR